MVLFSVGRIGATDGAQPRRGRPRRPTTAAACRSTSSFRTDGAAHLRRRRRDRLPEPRRDLERAGPARRLPRVRRRRPSPMGAHFPIGIYAIPEISMVGRHRAGADRASKVPYETGIARYREIARGQILGDDSGLFKMLFHREDRRLLGVHMHRHRRHRADPHRAGRARPRRRARLLPADGLQLSRRSPSATRSPRSTPRTSSARSGHAPRVGAEGPASPRRAHQPKKSFAYMNVAMPAAAAASRSFTESPTWVELARSTSWAAARSRNMPGARLATGAAVAVVVRAETPVA